MTLGDPILRASILCLLGGCAASTGSDPGIPAAQSEALIETHVSVTLPTSAGIECEPVGAPLTAYLGGVFSRDELTEETATRTAEGCRHEQIVAEPVGTFATLAYGAVCQGGNDVRVCGALEARRCSVDLMMQLAEERSEPVTAREPRFGLTFEVPPQDEDTRMALYARTRDEIEGLLVESDAVMQEIDHGRRDCPEEDRAEIDASFQECLDMDRMLDELLIEAR